MSKGFLARFFGAAQEVAPEEVHVNQRLTSAISNAIIVALKEVVGSYEFHLQDTDLDENFVIYFTYSANKYFKRGYTMDADGVVTLSDTAVEVAEAPPQWVEVKTAATETISETITAKEETVVPENKPCTCGAAITATAESETPATTTPDVEAITPEELQLVRDILARERAGEVERRQKAASVVAKATGVKTENLDNVPTNELEVLAKSLVATRYGSVSVVSTEPIASPWDTPKKEAN